MSDCIEVLEISQGERKDLTISVINEKTGEGIDLTNVTEIQSVHQKSKELGGFLVKSLDKIGVSEVSEITTLADSSNSLAGKYFKYYTPLNTYNFYFVVSGNGSNPFISGEVNVPVAISTDDDADTVAAALTSEMGLQADISASVALNVVTATNSDEGAVTNIADNNTGFSFSTLTEGVTEVVDSIEKVGTSQIKVKLSKEDTSILLVEPKQTIHLVIDFPENEGGRQIYKIENAYSVCESEFLTSLN